MDDYELGLAVPAVETGTLNRSASILIQAGFNSRLAAIKAVTDTGASFHTEYELRLWLNSDEVAALSVGPDWPTPETRVLWMQFVEGFTRRETRTWSVRRYRGNVAWVGAAPPPGTPVQIHDWADQPRLLSADGTPLGTVEAALNRERAGLIRAQVTQDAQGIDVTYLGPDDLSGRS